MMSLTSYSQENGDCSEHTMYSDIWRLMCEGDNIMFLPKERNSFPMVASQYYKNNVDEKKIESYLLESLNNFRKDYGKPPVKEAKWLTKASDAYSKKLWSSFKHDTRRNLGPDVAEDIAHYKAQLLALITAEDGDINRIIADSFFDYYVASPAHMHMLLNNKKYYGFGITFNDRGNFMGVVRSSNSPTRK